MKGSALVSRSRGGGGRKYHVANILPTASKGTLLAFVVDADEQGFPVGGTRAIIIL